ncbi:hypothetical protein NL500_30305, partial [Klebsiella pneumoniae]|nr:hypothetical protein [Klebsiella pneumoniae]
ISEIVSKSRTTVRDIIKRFSDTGSLENGQRTSRSSKFTVHEQRNIIIIIKKEPKTSSSSVTVQLEKYIGKNYIFI